MADGLHLPIKVYEVAPKKPVVVITWTGTQPELPSIFLNSHMDVVPVFRDKWTHDPFGAEMDEEGNIYGRGAQDMKCVGIQYCEAVTRLIESGVKLKRTVHIVFVPDEEIGGLQGMKLFVQTEDFHKLNMGCALDEDGPSPYDFCFIFNGEKSIWCAGLSTAAIMEVKLKPMVCPGSTDMRFVRDLGIPAFGFSPMNNTPMLLHENDEFLNDKVFLKGIDIYCKLIMALADV